MTGSESTERQAHPRRYWGIGLPPRTEPPDPAGFRLLAYERIPLQRLSLLSLATIPIWLVVFGGLMILLGAPSEFTFVIGLVDILVALVIILIGVPVVHEIVHGLVALFLGARPSYGVGLGFAYTTFRDPVGRSGYWVISLAPLVVISVAGLVWAAVWPVALGQLLIFLVTNAAGAIGDIWIAWRVRTLPPDVRIYDLADGYAAYVPDGPASES